MSATIPPLGDVGGTKDVPRAHPPGARASLWNDGAVAEDTWLRDRLALERTSLANERTLLAYVRTGLALVVAAAAAIHFLESALVDAVAWGCVVAGIFVLVYGLVRFRVVGGLIRKASRHLPPADPGDHPNEPLGG